MFKTLLTTLEISLCSVICLSTSPILAQVTSDDTVNTQVERDGNVAEITGGETRGSNLFHSFQDFSVGAGNEAYFNNAENISDIFSRVTGGNISNIDGLIRANGSANLFLINPAGIIFGEGARLDIGGSFYGSSASSILFEDGEFSAVDNLEQPILTINAPIGLNFRDEPGDIVNRSIVQDSNEEVIGLEVAPGNNLTLVGGNLNFEGGNLTVRGGNIELGGLSQAGTVDLNENGSLSFPEGMTLANITLTNAASVDVRGTGGGNIDINARNLTLAAGEFGRSSIRGGISADSTSIEAQAGDITINVAENISLNDSAIGNQVSPESVGNSGNIVINTGSLSLINGGLVDASTFGSGNAGEVIVTARSDIAADGENSQGLPSGITSGVAEGAEGDAGGVTISATNLNLTDGGRVGASTLNTGNAGEVNITARGDIAADGENSRGFPSGITSGVRQGAEGDAGGVTISTANLNLTNGGEVGASTFGSGNAGEVIVTARGDIAADGSNSQGFPSSITSGVRLGAQGDAGGVTIRATNLNLTNGAKVDASTFSTGNANNVTIDAGESIFINGSIARFRSGISANALNESGNAGNVFINTGSLTIANGGTIEATNFDNIGGDDSPGLGRPGNLTITANSIDLIDNARIEAATQFVGEQSGIINLQVAEDITVENNSFISAQARGDANGGNLNIDARFIVAFPSNGTGNDLVAAADSGTGGNITLDAEQLFGFVEGQAIDRGNNAFLSNSTNDLDVSGNVDGSLNITTDNIDPLQGATELPVNVVEPSETTQQACAANREAEAKNGLDIVGKGGVPPAPDLPLNSLNTITNGETNPTSTIPAPIETSKGKIQPARGIEVTPDGVIRLTAYRTNNAGVRLTEIKQNCDRI